jgi:hypothetical protein
MILVETNQPCLRVGRHNLYQRHYRCDTSHTTIFVKTIHLRVRIQVYAHIRTIVVLTSGNANWVTFRIYFQNLLIYNDTPTTR